MKDFLFFISIAAILIDVTHSVHECSTPNCCDEHKFCRFWSTHGECTKNPTWMLSNCARSCNNCARTSPNVNPLTHQATIGARPVNTRRQPSSSSLNAPAGCPAVMTRLLETRRVTTPDQLQNIWKQRACADMQTPSDCQTNLCFHKKYRSWDGTCNNLQNNLMGASYTPFGRLLPADYEDGIQTMSTRGRPPARALSTFLLSNRASIPAGNANSLLMQFSQFLSHDLTKNAFVFMCTTCESTHPQCANIQIPATDPLSRQKSCLRFTRSIPLCASRIGQVREQMNTNTAFIDASMVYHTDSISSEALRIGAFLKADIHFGRAFPQKAMGDSFLVGDDRNNLFSGLAAMHTVFLRLHNSIASSLQNLNPHWNQDRIFQETRKILGAAVQVITYVEFLPMLIGDFHKRLIPSYTRYDSTVDPSILNEFAGSAYRLHGMIQESYPLVDEHFRKRGDLPMANKISVMSIAPVLQKDFVEQLFRGMMMTPCRSPQRVSPFFTEKLLSDIDMASTNIQRGRDHGLRSYNDYRKLCRLNPLKSFNEWPEVPDQAVRNRVKDLYNGNVERVDLWVGGILEEPVEGSIVGPTFSCIIAEQFTRVRDGDRFFYENSEVFTAAQREQLKKISLSWVLCESSDNAIGKVPRSSFAVENGSTAVPCSQLPRPDLGVWRE